MFIATQPNALWKFNFDFSDQQGNQVGCISWPDVAVATNDRMKGIYPTTGPATSRSSAQGVRSRSSSNTCTGRGTRMSGSRCMTATQRSPRSTAATRRSSFIGPTCTSAHHSAERLPIDQASSQYVTTCSGTATSSAAFMRNRGWCGNERSSSTSTVQSMPQSSSSCFSSSAITHFTERHSGRQGRRRLNLATRPGRSDAVLRDRAIPARAPRCG